MAQSLTTYSVEEVMVVFAGKIVQGMAQDSGVQVSYNVDAFTYVPATDGSGTRVKSANQSGRVTITLNQSSASNDDLMALATADRLSSTGTGPLFIKDNSGRTLVTALAAWIVKVPDVELAESLGTRQWVLETDKLNVTIGGN